MNKKFAVAVLMFLGLVLVACGGSSYEPGCVTCGTVELTDQNGTPLPTAIVDAMPTVVATPLPLPTIVVDATSTVEATPLPLPTTIVETDTEEPVVTPHPDEIVPVGAEFIGQWELYFYWVPAANEQLVILRADSLPLSPYGFNRTPLGAAVDRNNREVVNAIFVKVEEDPANIVGSFYYEGRVEFFANNPPPLN